MNERDAASALYQHLSEAGLGVPISWPLIGIADQKPNRFLDVTLYRSPPLRLSLDGIHAQQYALQVAVMDFISALASDGIEPQGSTEIDGIADQVRAAFPVDAKIWAAGEAIRVMERPHIAGGYADGSYWRVPVTVRLETAD